MAYAQRAAIIDAFEHCEHNMTHAASRLKIGRNSLYRYIKELDISRAPKMKLNLLNGSIQETASPPTSRVIFADGQYTFASAQD